MLMNSKGLKAFIQELKKQTVKEVNSQTESKMDVENYDPEGKGSVTFADNIYGSYVASPLMYYGTNTSGQIGFHFIPIHQSVSNAIEQRTVLNVKAGEPIYVPLSDKTSEAKTLVEVYKFVEGENNVVTTLKSFDNSQEDSFFYNPQTVCFDGDMKIRDQYKYSFKLNEELGYYETEEINVEEFLEIASTVAGGQ